MKQFLIFYFMLFFSCSTAPNESLFRTDLFYNYQITAAAKEFFLREQFDLVPSVFVNDPMQITASTQVFLTFDPNAPVHIWDFVKMHKKNQAVFQLVDTKRYIGVVLDGQRLLATTNSVASQDKVLFEWLIPFAIKTSAVL